MHIPSLLAFWIAAAAVLLLPGALLARCVPSLWDRLAPGERVLPSFLLSAGFLGLVWALALPLFPTVAGAGVLWSGATVLLVAASQWIRTRRRRAGRDRAPGGSRTALERLDHGDDRRATYFVLAMLAAVSVVLVREGGSLGYVHDSLDFVAFVRRMLETGRIDIVSPAYLDTTGMGPDPRRGAFHLGMALVCFASRLSPVEMWRWLPVLLTPLSLWVFFATFRRVLSSARASAAALFFLTAALLFAPEHFLHNLAYASRLGWVYSWVALWALALFLDLERADRTPPSSWSPHPYPPEMAGRPGRAAAGLALVAPTLLLAVHVLTAVQGLAALAAFAWTWALARSEPRPVRRWLWLLPLLSGLLLAPFLVVKVLQSYSTANPLFDHPQGLLLLGENLVLLTPDAFARWFGWPGLLAMALVLPLLPRALENRAHAYLVGSTVVSALVLWNPIVTGWIERAGAHSLLFRMLYVAPIYPVLGYYADWALRRMREPAGRLRTALALLYLVLAGVFLVLEAAQAVRFFREPPRRRAPWAESAPLRQALEELDRSVALPAVIVSDPITSYQIPAYSRHHAIAPFHQHSSPADARAVERIHDATAIVNPHVGLARTVELLRRYRADYVLLNHSFPRYVRFYLASITPETFPAERAKFEGRPDLFEPLLDREGIVVFRFRDPGPGFDAPPPVLPYLVLPPEAAGSRAAVDLAVSLGATPMGIAPVGGLEPIGVSWQTRSFARGDYIRLITYWRRVEPAGPLPVEAFYRVETTFPDSRILSPIVGRAFRLYFERRAGLTYRFGRLRGPLEDRFPSFLWEIGAVYQDEYLLPIPRNAAPGLYTVSMRLLEQPFTPNIPIGDYFNVRDSLDGRPIGEITIVE